MAHDLGRTASGEFNYEMVDGTDLGECEMNRVKLEASVFVKVGT